jgi:hypothetical protein
MAAACGGSHETGLDAPAADAPSAFVEAPHGTVPQLVKLTGAVLTAPNIVPIFFANDTDMQAKVEDFAAQLATSAYWPATTTEYGVGSLTVRATIVTTDTPPATDTALDSWLAHHFDGQHGWPATPDPQTIYSVFLPDGAVLHTSSGDSCDAFAAYHDEATTPTGLPVVYALVPRCHYGDLVDAVTDSASHEWIEAATDPRVETALAFGDVDADHYIWAYTPGGETGDMCEYLDNASQRLVGPYLVQRTWSNAAAIAGHDPCIPATGLPYQAAAPMLSDSLPIDSFYNGTIMTKGVQISLHTSKTIEIALFSDAPTDVFTVGAADANALSGNAADLAFQWDRQAGKNGDTLHLTITRERVGTGQGSEFVVGARAGDANISLWWGFVGN